MKELKVRQISKKIEKIRPFAREAAGVTSWIRYIRVAYGMTMAQLAQRMGVLLGSVSQFERMEKENKITLHSLSKAAEALDCQFVYAFIPKQELKSYLEKVAREKAYELVRQSHLHMEYEDQAVAQQELEDQVEELVKELRFTKKIWD